MRRRRRRRRRRFGEYHNVDRAYDSLTSIRPCGPNKDAIRGATADVLRVTDVLCEEDITPLLSKTRELGPLGDDDGASTYLSPPCESALGLERSEN